MEVIHIAKRICDRKDLNEYGEKIYEPLYQIHHSKDKAEYEKHSKILWEILKLENEFKYIKIKALMVKVIKDGVFVVIPKKDSNSNRNNAIYQDIAFIMFDLLSRKFYNKECFGVKNIGSYEMRYSLYIEANSYTRECFAKSASVKHKWPERITATIANFLSKQEDVANYLQKAMCEYTRVDNNGIRKFIRRNPCLTAKNFPSLIQKDFSECSKRQQPAGVSGALVIYENCVTKHYTLSPASAEQFEGIVQERKDGQNGELYPPDGLMETPPALDEPVESQHLYYTQKDTEKLSFAKSNNKLLDVEHYKKKIKLACNILRKLQPICVALSVILSSLNTYDQALSRLNQIIIAMNNNVYNEENPDFTVKTEVRTGWGKDTVLSIGDKVEFQINYKNTSDATQTDVAINDILPSNLRYINGTTKVYNSTYPKGFLVDSNEVVGEGIRIGTYDPGANALIRFQAEVVNDNFTCGKFVLHNWGRATVNKNNKVVQDSAAVNVQLATCPDPENDIEV